MPKKPTREKPECHICIDCEQETSNFYKIQTNRGDVIKCRNCYELWIIRTTRYSGNDFGGISRRSGSDWSMKQDGTFY